MGVFEDIKNRLAQAYGGTEKPKNEETAADQSSDEQKLAGYIKSKVEESRTSSNRIAHEGIWMTNIAYALGFDSVYYDSTTKQFKPLNTAQSYVPRTRARSNQILPAMQNRLARLCKQPPKFDVRPEDKTETSKEAARLGIEIISMYWDKNQLNKKRIELGMWLQQCGVAYLKVYWDDQAGEELVNPVTQEFEGYEGDIRIDVVNPFEVYVDPLAKNMDEVTWLVQAKPRKLEYFKTHYPEKGMMVQAEEAWLLSTQYELRINTLNAAGPTASNISMQMKDAAIELNYYEKPSRKHRKGRHVIVANGVILKDDELPVGEIPIAKFDDILIGGKFFSESCVTHARPLQDQYNRVLARRDQWVKRLLAGKYIAAKGHGLTNEALNDQIGEVVEYDPVAGAREPHAMDMPVIPSYVYEETRQLKSEIFEIFGLSEVARGQLPSAGIPAVGMQLLLEQDETRIGIETEQHEHAFAQIGHLVLKYCDKFVKTPRKLKTKGKNLQYQVQGFTGESLKGHTDVIVIRGSTVPNSKSLRRQDIMNAYDKGLLGDPRDPKVREQVLGSLEFGDVGELWTDSVIDETQINRTIAEIEQGIVPEVNQLDNHMLHIVKKNRYRKSEKFLELDPLRQQILLDDIETHLDAAARIANPNINSMERQAEQLNAMTPEEGAMTNPEVAAGAMAEGQPALVN